MNGDLNQLFDAVAGDYDRQRRRLIPCFDDFYGMALSLADSKEPSPRILDLGAGTGLFSHMVLQKYPGARLTLIDLSEKMLDGARKRFRSTENVQYIAADYSKFDFSETYDIVLSSLSIHHLTHPMKRRLFAAAYRILPRGGVFVNADQVQGNSASKDAYYRERWLRSIRQSGLPQDAIEAAVERRKLDINATLQDQIMWLRDAGFADADCMYKYLDFAVFYGTKDGPVYGE